MAVFINEAINNGINNYLSKVNGRNIKNIYILELSIVEVLVRIYDEINIINPFKLNDEKSFKDNLKLYGLKEKEYSSFIRLLNRYNKWLNSTISQKNDIVKNINYLLIKMILLRHSKSKFSEDDINFFDNYFKSKNDSLKRIFELSSIDSDVNCKLWERKKRTLLGKSPITLTEIIPKLFTDDKYKKYGLSLNEVKQLSNMKINEINKLITEEENSDDSGGRKKSKPLQLVLTSGSGFVDTIVLLSVMTTEIMIGLIIAFTIAGR